MSPGSTTRPEIPFARLEPKLASFPGGNELHQPARGQRCSERSPSSPPTGVTHQVTLLNQAPLNGHASLSFIHHAHICRGFTCAQLIHWPSSASTVGTLTGYQMENHENTTPCSRTAMLYIFLPPHSVSRCQRLQETDVAVASACIICVPIYYNEKFAAALTRCANTNTRSFSKSSPKLQINKSNNKMKTWSQKHDTISCGWTNTSPAPAPPPSAALCPESPWSSSGWIFCSFMALCGSSLTPQWQLCMVH